uniref:C2H2-type domain-containing protein n=1 Tax=Mola mola TaxID=94237 RepID=A0A3Q3X422_MOLML
MMKILVSCVSTEAGEPVRVEQESANAARQSAAMMTVLLFSPADQLKSVMKQVLDFAVRELTKIVEASFDDLLLEIAKMEEEQLALEERLSKSGDSGAGGGAGGRRRGSENDSVSPSGSEDAEVAVSKEADTKELARPPILSVSQDWVPILDKVFAPKWCNDIRQMEGVGDSGRGPGEGRAPPLTLEPSPSSPQQDPRWTPLEDMEVWTFWFLTSRLPVLRLVGRRSSASMLHRLLTLPSQLMEDEQGAAAALAADVGVAGQTRPSPPTAREEEEEEEDEEEDEEEKTRKKKRRRVWSECEECGRRFSRMSLLKAHRQTHFAENAATDASSPSSPPGGAALVLRCSRCGKRFSSATRLRSHVQNQH